jgi:hypothetical protein
VPFEHILDGETRCQSQDYVHVGQTEVGVEEHYPCPQGLESIGKIDHNVRFPYPPFAAGKGEDLHTGVSMGRVRTASVHERTTLVRLPRPQGLELMLPGIIGQASQGACLIHGVGSSPFRHTCVIVPL